MAKLERLQELRRLRTEQQRRQVEARRRARYAAGEHATPGSLARAMDPRTVQTAALDLLDESLVDIAEGTCKRLIFSMPPQEGKSERTSRRFPLWLLTRNPDLRIAIVSYELGVARRWGRVIRNDIGGHPELGLTVRRDTSAAHEWQLEEALGGVYSVGIGGALTGRPVDCFVGSTVILTDHGYTSIREVYQSKRPVRVLSWNHAERRVEWKPVRAARRITDREVVEVTTAAGRSFRCTPDHRIYTSNGYREASLLRPGDSLLVGRLDGHANMPAVRSRAEEDAWCDLHGLLHEGSRRDVADAHVPAVQCSVSEDARRAREGSTKRAGEHVLLASVCADVEQGAGRKPMQAVWHADAGPREGREVLLRGVSDSCTSGEETEGLPALRDGLRVLQRPSRVLHEGVRRCGPLDPDDRSRELPIQGRNQLRQVVPTDATVGRNAGPASVPGVPATGQAVPGCAGKQDVDAIQPADTPHQRGPGGQPAGEPDLALQDVPRGAPQIGEDTVSVVRHLRGERHDVYDIQVDGNNNFFADEVLVHNCLIIDDPLKGRKEADSPTYRQVCWDFWTDTARTRFAPNTAVVVVQTRWHEDDLAGRLLSGPSAGDWRYINVPAQAEGDDDPLGRAPGEYLVSARGRTVKDWEDTRRDVGAATWASLYQGHPAPAEGGLFKRSNWRWYGAPRWTSRSDGSMWVHGADELIQSWDMTFKDTKGSDFVVGQVWARFGAEVYLLDQIRDRLDFPATCRAVQALSAKWPQANAKLVEDKANGPAVISQLRSSVPGMIAVNPEGSKYARASAVSPFQEAGNVYLPEPSMAPWVDDYIVEHSSFPNGAHDDQVDGTSQALARLLINEGSAAQAMDWLRQMREAGGGAA